MMIDHDVPAEGMETRQGCQVNKLKSHKQEEYTDNKYFFVSVIRFLSTGLLQLLDGLRLQLQALLGRLLTLHKAVEDLEQEEEGK